MGIKKSPNNSGTQKGVINQTINGQKFRELIFAGFKWLKSNKQLVNSLNVFPVPDGDTGTNMYLTMQSACNEINNTDDKNIGRIARQVAQGALMGARGNSGVILSQIFRGFARVLDEKETLNSEVLNQALAESRNTAYKGVVRPVEGTILTVVKDIAKAADKASGETKDLVLILENIVKEADESVKRTPELLPILKQAGVVDSGGIGLFFIIEGMLRYISNQPVDIEEKLTTIPTSVKLSEISTHQIQERIEPGQDFEVVVDFNPHNPINITTFYNELQRIGTSVQLGEGDNMYRMHIHVPADKKYDPIEFIMKHGTVTKVYIENLMEQMKSNKALNVNNKRKTQIQKGQVIIIAVSPGEGISQIFRSLGVAAIISGGQTMNPSTQEILDSYINLPTDEVIILPNNKNIILAAESASKMSDKNVVVIPSKSIPQGLAAALCYSPEVKMEDVVVNMNKACSEVDTGEITTAIRSIYINGLKVKKGEVIALLNGDLIGSSDNLGNACLMLLQKINLSEKEHLTIFYGKNIKKSEVEQVAKLINTKFPEFEIETHYGGQPHYQFILSIE